MQKKKKKYGMWDWKISRKKERSNGAKLRECTRGRLRDAEDIGNGGEERKAEERYIKH